MRVLHVLAILSLILLANCASPDRHWSPFEPSRREDWHGPSVLILRYDGNNDRQVTRRELEAGLRQEFWQADSQRDGHLDPNEMHVANLRRIRIDQSTAIPLIDWNHDGYVDFNEFAAPMRSLFEQFDTDADNIVTLKEMNLKAEHVPAATPVPAGPISVPP